MISEKVLALSWKQPYGSLMLPPFNKIETRTWKTNYRGLVLICASKTGYNWNQVQRVSGGQFFSIITLGSRLNVNMGHAIALARLADCRPMTKEDEEKCFVQYFPDLYCHVYEDVRPIIPFPWKGKQGWTELTAAQKQLIRFPLKSDTCKHCGAYPSIETFCSIKCLLAHNQQKGGNP